MSQQLPQDGVRLVVEGVSQFIDNMNKAGVAWDRVSASFTDASGKTRTLSVSTDKVASSVAKAGSAASQALSPFDQMIKGFGQGAIGATGMNGALSALSGGVAGVSVMLGQVLVAALKKVGEALKTIFIDLPKEAAPLEGISAQFSTLTQNIEGGSRKMMAALQAGSSGMIPMRDLMTQFNNASALVSDQFAQNLPQALGLLGKVSAATGKDMNYLMESLVNGVGRVTPLVIDNLTVQVSQAEATARATEMFNKQKEALSKLEQQTALNTLVMEKLEAKYGALPDIGATTSAQLAVMSAHFQNIKDILGQAMLPAFNTLLTTLNTLVGTISSMLSEGGELEPWLIRIGALTSLWADGIAILGEALGLIAPKAAGMYDNIAKSVFGIIEDALTWGVELIAQFAAGMAEAASSILIQALNFIGGILEQWLLGASPPKIAPGIEQWGIKTFERYLTGMTEADFGILEGIQKPLQKILEGPALANVSKIISGALAGGDRATIFDTVSKSAGIFGSAINKMIGLQFELADSTKAVEEAELALEQARNKLLGQQDDVNKATVEYNRLLREGADPAVLKEKLAQINAAEEAMRLTQDQVQTQDEFISSEKQRIEGIKTEAELQKKLVDQLLGVNDALQVQEEKGKKGAAGVPTIAPEVSGLTGTLGTRLGTAIEGMKEKLKEKFRDIFAPLSEAWDKIVLKVGDIGTAWEKFKAKVGSVWDDLKLKYPVLQDIEDLIQNLKTSIPELATELSDKFHSAWSKIWGILSGQEDGGILGALTAVWDFLKDSWGTIMESDAAKAIKTFTTDVIERLKTGVEGIVTAVGNMIAKIGELARLPLDKIREALGWGIAESPAPLALGLQQINRELVKMSGSSLPSLGGSMRMMPAMAPVSSSSMTTNNNSPIQITFSGPVTIGSTNDMRQFTAQLERTVRNVMERR